MRVKQIKIDFQVTKKSNGSCMFILLKRRTAVCWLIPVLREVRKSLRQ